jgi:hypothetical protein
LTAALISYRGVRVPADWPERIAHGQQVTHYTSSGRPYPRVRFGDDDPLQGEVPCSECAVVKGEFHVPDCQYEICPVCKTELLYSCDCSIDEMGARREPSAPAGGLLGRESLMILLAVLGFVVAALVYWGVTAMAGD